MFRSDTSPKRRSAGNPFLRNIPSVPEVQAPKNIYRFPTKPDGGFATAMSSIACNAETQSQGVFSNISGGDDKFREQLTQALALKINFKTTQHANEKALLQIIKSKGSAHELKQALQARAAVYGDLLDTAWFTKNSDLSKKTKDVHQRRLARAMLTGAVVLTAQIGAHRVRTLLTSGDEDVIANIRRDDYGTAGQFAKALARAPVVEVLKFLAKDKASEIVGGLLQNADDLDYLQNLITSIGKQPSINPTMNAVVDAFARRRIAGRFKTAGQSVALDTLLQQSTKTVDDDDATVAASSKQTRQNSGRKPNNLCYLFQRNECTFQPCLYRHRCSICFAVTHGSMSCNRYRRQQNPEVRSRERGTNSQRQSIPSRPPNPRFRRDRATNANAL